MLLECAFIVAYYFLFHTKFLAKVRTKFFSDNIVFTTQDSNYFWIFIFGCFFMAFNSSSSIMARLAMYFYLGFIYYLFRFVDNFKNETIKKIFYISLTVFLGLYFIYNTPTLGLVPYAFR